MRAVRGLWQSTVSFIAIGCLLAACTARGNILSAAEDDAGNALDVGAGCPAGGNDDGDDNGTADGDGEGSPECGASVVGVCSEANTAACLYTPALTYEPHKLVPPLELLPPHRRGPVLPPEVGLSVLPVTVWVPVGAPEPVPVVVFSHGGGSRQVPGESGLKWSQEFAKAGYVVLAMHHMARSESDVEHNVCQEQFGVPAVECDLAIYTQVYESTDRPQDAMFVLDSLEAIGELVGVSFDGDHVAVAGHSGGTNTPFYLSGAVRNVLPPDSVTELLFCAPDTRPKAFIAMSPPGVEAAGWKEDSLAAVDRPFLTGTGAGDLTPLLRIEPHERLEPDNKYRIFINSTVATHKVFNLLSDSGGDFSRMERQATFHRWLVSAATAFLDAHVRGCDDARTWLQSGDIATAIEAKVESGGIAPAWSVR